MGSINQEVLRLARLGYDQKTSGKYDQAYHTYYKALEINPEHQLIRNGLAELLFIEREYLSAADNFYIAAVDDSYHLDLDFDLDNQTSDNSLLLLEDERVHKAQGLLENYALKTGFSLFAHRFDNPIAKTPRQAAINTYRKKFDPYGYSSLLDVEPAKMKLIETKARGFGYDFLDTMNQRKYHQTNDVLPLEFIIHFFDVKY